MKFLLNSLNRDIEERISLYNSVLLFSILLNIAFEDMKAMV